MSCRVVFERISKDLEPDEKGLKELESLLFSQLEKGNEVYLIEKYPKKISEFSKNLKLEKAEIEGFSVLQNERLYKISQT